MTSKPSSDIKKQIFRPTCPKCKSYRFVTQEEIIVHLEFETVWQCDDCVLVIGKVPYEDILDN